MNAFPPKKHIMSEAYSDCKCRSYPTYISNVYKTVYCDTCIEEYLQAIGKCFATPIYDLVKIDISSMLMMDPEKMKKLHIKCCLCKKDGQIQNYNKGCNCIYCFECFKSHLDKMLCDAFNYKFICCPKCKKLLSPYSIRFAGKEYAKILDAKDNKIQLKQWLASINLD